MIIMAAMGRVAVASSGEKPRTNWRYCEAMKNVPNMAKKVRPIVPVPMAKRRSRNCSMGSMARRCAVPADEGDAQAGGGHEEADGERVVPPFSGPR